MMNNHSTSLLLSAAMIALAIIIAGYMIASALVRQPPQVVNVQPIIAPPFVVNPPTRNAYPEPAQ